MRDARFPDVSQAVANNRRPPVDGRAYGAKAGAG